jgi:hypothetical protein
MGCGGAAVWRCGGVARTSRVGEAGRCEASSCVLPGRLPGELGALSCVEARLRATVCVFGSSGPSAASMMACARWKRATASSRRP